MNSVQHFYFLFVYIFLAVLKINAMYKADCNNDTVNVLDIHEHMIEMQQELVPNPMQPTYFATIVKWFESLLGLADIWN